MITRKKISPASILARVADKSAGGTVLFLGTVRNRSEGRGVRGLQYEAYKKMAEARMKEIESEVRKRWRISKIAMVHRQGKLEVGDVSVAVAVSSEHRAEAFEACRYAIDRIKQSLPIWKKEMFTSGESGWVSGSPIES